jgi:hypothetical protein
MGAKGKEAMPSEIHECECEECRQSKDNPNWQVHHQMNVFVSRLDEQQRRWYVGLESKKEGHGGDTLLSKITGMDVETIRRGRRELDEDLQNRPAEKIRLEGGGRPSAEKKTRSYRPH